MKLTLRKAHAVQAELTNLIKHASSITAMVQVNEFEDATIQIDRARANALAQLARREKLSSALMLIRTALGDKNAASGVNKLVATHAAASKDVQRLIGLAAQVPRATQSVVDGQLAKLRNSTAEQRRYGADFVQVSVFTKEDIDGFKRELQKAKRELQGIGDKLLALNTTHTIDVDEATAKLLEDESLV